MLRVRVVSALIAVFILGGTFALWKTDGLYIICSLMVAGCIFEFARLTFARLNSPFHLKAVFCLLTAALYATTVWSIENAIYVATVSSVVFLTMALMTVRRSLELPRALHYQSLGLMGFFYCGFFPGLAVQTLSLERGAVWFLGLLAVVFAGDTFAYLAGRFFGKRKLLEPVSPKKTIEGSIGGLFGSMVAGATMAHFFFPEIPLLAVVGMALVTGAFAQVGDLFESLLKRIAEVKDSGRIMPGHGGILDRLDGVIFGAPIYYVLARVLTGA